MMNIMIYEDNRECIGNLQGILREYFEERSIMFSMFITKLGAFCDFDSGNILIWYLLI